ncbi:hypothetical protein PZA11_007092 [Diplocarpon coronariae]
MAATRIQPTPNSPSKIQIARVSHVYLRHPDPDKFLAFGQDFGLVEEARHGDAVYLRGYGVDPYCYVVLPSLDEKKEFGGTAFLVQSKEDLEKAMKLPGATRKSLTHAPGGGELVSLVSPGGTKLHLLWGQETRSVPDKEPSAQVISVGPQNLPFKKERQGALYSFARAVLADPRNKTGEFQRFKPGPAMVHKLGHYGYSTSSFDADASYYLDNFNLTPSDILYDPDMPDLDVLVFLHIDLGAAYSDHHTFFMQRAPPGKETAMHHCSFEVADFDTQLLGHQWLAAKGYESIWGVGRHILGSQIFDYWRDPSGFIAEHYADGDVVNQDTPVSRQEAGPNSLSVWGPPVPAEFGGTGH